MNEKFFDLNREKQDRIINAALKVFSQNDYRHASTDVIVKEASISKGLLFHYFTSKQGLYLFLFDYSVRYMLLEYSRTITESETDYFTIRKKMEGAKLKVLRNYPYMNEFIERGMALEELDIIASTEEVRNTYFKTIQKYYAQGQKGKLRNGLKDPELESLIRYTVEGLARDQMKENSYQPEMLYEQICEYFDIIRAIAVE